MKLKFLTFVLLLFVFKQTIVLSENLDISVYTGTFDWRRPSSQVRRGSDRTHVDTQQPSKCS